MKNIKILLPLFVLASVLLLNTGCEDSGSKAGVSGDQSELYSLVPDSATGLFTINFKKLSSISAFDKIKDDMKFEDISKKQKLFKDYADFIEKTGIDPKKDINSAVMAIYSELDEKDPELSIIADLKYNKEKLLSVLKISGKDFQTSDLNGMTLYSGKDEKGKEGGFIFLSDKIITAGTIEGVKNVAAMVGKKGKNILDDPKMKSYMEKAGSTSIFSFVFRFPEKMKGMKGNGMIQADLSKAEALYGNVDFSSNTWSGKFVLVSMNEEGNNNLVTTLNGLKGLGAMGGPEIAELINNIDISSTPDSIILSFKISNELLEKLKKKAEEKTKNLIN
ncbi:MAG: hypothetical protein ABFR36_02005 [Acidobacteriota bacterium]